MAVTQNDIVKYTISPDMLTVAKYFANFRILFEYPRNGYGNYNINHIPNIVNGYIGEFAFLQYAYDYLHKKYGGFSANERFELLKKRNFNIT